MGRLVDHRSDGYPLRSDFWSRPEDAEVLTSHLTSAARVRTVTIPGATHFVHLDRPERGRAQFVEEVVRFLSGG